MSVAVVHRWRSAEPEQVFDCGRAVGRHMRWDIRPLTRTVLEEHKRYGAFGGGKVRACRQCSDKKQS